MKLGWSAFWRMKWMKYICIFQKKTVQYILPVITYDYERWMKKNFEIAKVYMILY